MQQNPIYVAPGGKPNNRTVEEAEIAVRKLRLVGIPSLGIIAEGTGGQRVEYFDFEANGINPKLPANLLIRTSAGNGPDKNEAGEEIENSVADHGSYMNVDRVLDAIKSAANAAEALAQLISEARPGIKPDQINAAIDSLPGVRLAKNEAVLAAWKAA
jgi:hypothetical protein